MCIPIMPTKFGRSGDASIFMACKASLAAMIALLRLIFKHGAESAFKLLLKVVKFLKIRTAFIDINFMSV